MLVLTRKSGQELVINEQVRIRVLSSRTGSVRLGIEAPQDVSVLRGEIDLIERLLSRVSPNGQSRTAKRFAQIPR